MSSGKRLSALCRDAYDGQRVAALHHALSRTWNARRYLRAGSGDLRVVNVGVDRAILDEWSCFANAEITQACELIENERGEGCTN